MTKNENATNQTVQQTPAVDDLEELKKQLEEANARAAKAEACAESAEKKAADAAAQLKAITDAKAMKVVAAKADTVRIRIPMEKNGPKEAQQVFINGRQYIIKRGVEVDVPRGVAEILQNREKMLEVIHAFDAANAQD